MEIKFSPDICERFEQFSRHTVNKHKTINEFVSILKEICDLEEFYSRNLEKLAESTSKLILGKDTLKGIFIVFERLLSSLSEQAKNVAESIKSDMMPYVKTLVNPQNFKYLEEGKHVKEIYNEMQKKFKGLQFYKRNYVSAYNNWSVNGSLSPPALKQQLKVGLVNAERDLTSNIQFYNQAVDVYILNVSELTTMFTQSQTTRKRDLKSAVQKNLIYQVDRIKNVEYNIGNYCKNLDALEDKLFIHQKTSDETNRTPLVKVSSSNYLQFLKDGVLDHSLISQRQNVVEMLKKQLRGEINQNQYNSALKELYFAMDYCLETRNFDMLKEIVDWSSTVYKVLPEADDERKIISLKEGVLGHDIFIDESFWKDYAEHVILVIQRENGSLGSFDLQEESLQEALRFIKGIKMNQVISKNLMGKLKSELANLRIEVPELDTLIDNAKGVEQRGEAEEEAREKTVHKKSDEFQDAEEYTQEEYEAFS